MSDSSFATPMARVSMTNECVSGVGDLIQYRQYLRHRAGNLVPQIRGRHDPSDLVQMTLLEAHAKRAQFQGENKRQMAAWLTRILSTKVADVIRDAHRQKRSVLREQSIFRYADSSATHGADRFLGRDNPPSQNLRKAELNDELWSAVSQLTDGQRTAIDRHYAEGKTLADIAVEMDISRTAVAGLISRGLKKLRQNLVDPS